MKLTGLRWGAVIGLVDGQEATRSSNSLVFPQRTVDVVGLFMALLSFVESAPQDYRLKASNAAPPFSTSVGSTSCKADDCLWVQVPSGQSRSGQIGIESCGRRGNARSEV
jgi:hypothetical protein